MKGIVTVTSKRINGVIGKDEYLSLYNEALLEKKNTVLIALHDPTHFPHPDFKVEGFDDVLQMHFWDVEDDIGQYKALTPEQGTEIKEFILKHPEKQFLIHCHAGHSRSAGVGCAVGKLLDNVDIEDNEISKHSRYEPNRTVYERIIKG